MIEFLYMLLYSRKYASALHVISPLQIRVFFFFRAMHAFLFIYFVLFLFFSINNSVCNISFINLFTKHIFRFDHNCALRN